MTNRTPNADGVHVGPKAGSSGGAAKSSAKTILTFPDMDLPAPWAVVVLIAIGLGFWAFKRKQSRKRIEVVYERGNDD